MSSLAFLRLSLVSARAAMCLALGACSGTDVGYPRVSEAASCPDEDLGPPTPDGRGGTSGAATTGASGGGGAAAVGTGAGGAATGAPDTGGSATAAPFIWPGPYDASARPSPADGQHNAGSTCMLSSCHGGKVPFAFGGTVYQADGLTAAQQVEVGISDAARTVTVYSAANGNVWLPADAASLDFASARIAVRNARGERIKPSFAPRGASCNASGCHGAALRLLEP